MSSALATTTAGALPVFLLGGLAPLIRQDLDFDASLIGTLVALYFGTSALISLYTGSLADRLGSRSALRAGVSVSVLALGGIALIATSWAAVALFLVLGGVANALIQPAANLALARGVPARWRGFAFGIKQAAIPAASAAGGFAVPLLGLTLGWRYAFGAAALLALAAILLPARDGVRPRGTAAAAKGRIRGLPRPLYLMAAGIGLSTGGTNSAGAYLVEATVAGGWDPGTAGALLGTGGLLAVVARVAVGWLADRMAHGHIRLVGLMMLAGALGFVGLVFVDVPVVLRAGVVLVFAAGWGLNGLFVYSVVLLHPPAPATATGLAMVGGFGGAVLIPVAFGFVAAATSYAVAWLGAAVLSVVGATLILRVHRIVHRRRPSVSP